MKLIAGWLSIGLLAMVVGFYYNEAKAESHILVDNKPLVLSSQYTVSGVTEQSAKRLYSIAVVSEGNGKISPAGTINVAQGEVMTFAFLPVAGYHVAAIRLDGKLYDTVDSLTFINVIADHSLEVVFAEDNESPFTLAVSR